MPTRTKELREQFSALVTPHTGEHFRTMIESRMTQQIDNGSGHSRFVIPRAKDHAIDARENNCAGTHRTRFERDVQRAPLETPRIQRGRSGSND